MERAGIFGAQAGGLMAILGKLTLNDWLSIGGFSLAVVSVMFQIWATWFFKSRHLRIAEQRLAADLAHEEDD